MKNYEKYTTAQARYEAFYKHCRGTGCCDDCPVDKTLGGEASRRNYGQCAMYWLELDAVEKKEDWRLAIDEAALIKKRLFGLPVNFCFVLNESAFDGLVANACLQDGNGDPITEETPSSDIFVYGIPCRIGSGSDRPVHAEVWLESEVK